MEFLGLLDTAIFIFVGVIQLSVGVTFLFLYPQSIVRVEVDVFPILYALLLNVLTCPYNNGCYCQNKDKTLYSMISLRLFFLDIL